MTTITTYAEYMAFKRFWQANQQLDKDKALELFFVLEDMPVF